MDPVTVEYDIQVYPLTSLLGNFDGRRFAVIVNDVIVTAPNIRTAITGGSGFIEGGFDNMEEARELAYIINRNNAERRKTGAQ